MITFQKGVFNLILLIQTLHYTGAICECYIPRHFNSWFIWPTKYTKITALRVLTVFRVCCFKLVSCYSLFGTHWMF